MKIYAVVEPSGPPNGRENTIRGLYLTAEEAFVCRKLFKEEKHEKIFGDLIVLQCVAGKRIFPGQSPPQILEPREEAWSSIKESDLEPPLK